MYKKTQKSLVINIRFAEQLSLWHMIPAIEGETWKNSKTAQEDPFYLRILTFHYLEQSTSRLSHRVFH